MASQESETARAERLLIETAKSTTTDLYALLSLPSPFPPPSTSTPGVPAPSTPRDPPTEAQLKKAWRAAALIHHPDKNPGREQEAANKLDEIRKGYDILANQAARQAYDDKLRARAEKQVREAAFEGKRRRMKEELEMRESAGKGLNGSRPGTPGEGLGNAGERFGANGVGSPVAGRKRKFAGGTAFGGTQQNSGTAEEDAELRRLAQEGARRRMEREERVRREREEATRKEESGEVDEGGEVEEVSGSSEAPAGTSTPVKKFTFSTPNGSAQKTGVGTPASASTKSMFQSTMQRLKEAEQRRKSGLQHVSPQEGGDIPAATG